MGKHSFKLIKTRVVISLRVYGSTGFAMNCVSNITNYSKYAAAKIHEFVLNYNTFHNGIYIASE